VDYLKLSAYAKNIGLEVFSTPFDDESIDFLAENNQRIWKIPSGEITNIPFLKKIAKLSIKNKLILLSTGMSTIDEIEDALKVLDINDNEIIVLHCNTEYPTEDVDVNVSAILDMQKKMPKYEIGFSDHSRGYVAPIMAVAYGVHFIEKHFTLDRNMPGPDQKASIIPAELKILCDSVRRAEIMRGNGHKVVTDSERKNKKIARKSIVAKCSIKQGDLLSEENLICKRPGNGISPKHWDEVLGKTAEKDFEEDELIQCRGIEWEGND
jgi:N-acetylneuraminate synthase